MKQILKEFIENCSKIKTNDKSATLVPLKGNLGKFNFYASFGKGSFAYVPWFGFFAYNQIVTKGIYPVLLYNTKTDNNNLEVCYSVSEANTPNTTWNTKYTENLTHSKTEKYSKSFVKKTFTINSIEDYESQKDNIIKQIDLILIDYNEQFTNTKISNDMIKIKKDIIDNTNEKLLSKNNIHPLNQILYGPPGTGKTYNTVLKAMSIIDNTEYKDVSEEKYSVLKTRFDELKQAGQIEFVTFHQSYSYEEFVEGIKPIIENENCGYKLEAGIFKNICEKASKTTEDNFNDVYESFINRIADCDEDDYYKLYTLKNNKVFGLKVNSNNNLNVYMSENFNKQGVITRENLEKYFNKERTTKDWSNYYDSIVNHLIKEYNLTSHKSETKPHVLIIDEINRGDVSKIFGELITLIEEDKRIGNKYQMKITLPYSKEQFGVPNNLYIIGTMNTADRSIALLDTALRRRFDFEEIMPRPELLNGKNVEGINLQILLTRINGRITNKYDRDHQIGHSYLMGVNTKEQLERAYKNRILPLLNEYFYNESKTVAEILNCSEDELKTGNIGSILSKAQGE